MGLVAIGTLSLTGCGSTEAYGDESSCVVPEADVVVAASARANMRTASASTIGPYLLGAMRSEKSILVIDSSGDPSSKGEVSFVPNTKNGPAQQQELQARATQLKQLLASSIAAKPEANPLKALGLAADHLKSKGTSGTIVLVDSGLQTTGVLDYTAGGTLQASPADLANQIEAKGHLPDLTGMTVIFVGIGDTAEPQKALDQQQKTQLRGQWQAIAQEAGAACVKVDPAPLTGPAGLGLLPVKTVDVPDAKPLAFADRVVIGSDSIAFKDNSAELLDPVAAKTKLQEIATSLASSGRSITLTGTTANDQNPAGEKTLSQARAEAVKALLVDLGVDAGTITTEGVGINFPGYVKDIDANGKQIPSLAAKNRTVILSVNS